MPVDVSSSEIAPNPGEALFELSNARAKIGRLTDMAIARGDEVGAEAWRAAAKAIDVALEEVRTARNKQTWSAKRTEPCPTCRR